jgi:thymidylate synthase
MNHNFCSTDVNAALPYLMGELLLNGEQFGSRAGATLELMHVGITLTEPLNREIVLPERKASIAAQIAETMWVLSGRNDVEGLSHYLPRAADFSDDGKEWRAGYGPRLRNYQGVDQLDYIIGVMADNPGSRQAVASLWDPVVDTTPGKDIARSTSISTLASDPTTRCGAGQASTLLSGPFSWRSWLGYPTWP